MLGRAAIALIVLGAAVAAASVATARSTHPILYVHNASSGTLLPGAHGRYILTLRGVPSSALYFADAPGRAQGRLPLAHVLQGLLRPGADRPNAAVDAELPGSGRRVMGVELLWAHYDARSGVARYGIRRLPQGTVVGRSRTTDRMLPRRFGRTSMLIDDAGERVCGGTVLDSTDDELFRTSQTKYSHDDWSPSSPAEIDDRGAAGAWASTAGFDRGCWNSVSYAGTGGTVNVYLQNPWSGSNTVTCSVTGLYHCETIGITAGNVIAAGLVVTEIELQASVSQNDSGAVEIDTYGQPQTSSLRFNDGEADVSYPTNGPNPDSVTISRPGLAATTVGTDPGTGELSFVDSAADPTVSTTYTLVAHTQGWPDRTLSLPYTSTAPPPSAPSSVALSVVGGSAHLKWQPPSSPDYLTGYRVYRIPQSGSQTLLATLDASTLSYTDPNAAGAFGYGVSAINAVGEGPLVILSVPQ